MNILITGANGLIGHRLCRQLLAAGHRVWALSRTHRPALLMSLLTHDRLRLVTGDITDIAFTDALFGARRYQGVVHLAVARHVPSPDKEASIALRDTVAYRVNYEGTLNLLQSAARHAAGFWIQGSAMMVYDIEHIERLPVDESQPAGPVEPNGLSVFLAEQACHYYGRVHRLPYAVLRYPGVYGFGKQGGVIARFVRHCLCGDDPPLAAPANRTSDFLYAEDAADGARLAIQWLRNGTPEKTDIGLPVFHVGSGEETSIAEVARLIRELTGGGANFIDQPAGQPRRFCFDNTRARRILGFRPRSIRQGLSEYIDRMRKEIERDVKIGHSR